jgi:hypothetical protein
MGHAAEELTLSCVKVVDSDGRGEVVRCAAIGRGIAIVAILGGSQGLGPTPQSQMYKHCREIYGKRPGFHYVVVLDFACAHSIDHRRGSILPPSHGRCCNAAGMCQMRGLDAECMVYRLALCVLSTTSRQEQWLRNMEVQSLIVRNTGE